MSRVSALGYLGLGVSDLNAWEDYAVQVLGLQSGGRTADGKLMLRMDEYQYRYMLHQDRADDLAYVGWETATAESLADLAAALQSAGVNVKVASTAEAHDRGVIGLVRFNDPNGLATEIFCGPMMLFEEPFHSARPISGFVTGEQGLGHIVVAVKSLEQSVAFYRDVLGFRMSDEIELDFGGGMRAALAFLHCNPRQHSIAMMEVPMPRRLHHIMLQLRSLDDVGSTFDLVQERGIEITATLGKHTNDHMVSFYLKTPSGFEIEYGWGARTIDDTTWQVQRHRKGSIWGHRRVMPLTSRK